jgi:transposase InsO family protein
MDLFVVPTFSFRLLYGLLILKHGRRQILSLGVTAHPTAEWIARQLTEACGWDGTPEYLVRDHDSVYGAMFTRRVRAMGIRDRPIAPRSPWQNGHAERLTGSLRGNVLTMSSSSASSTCANCSFCTWTITTKRGHTYP